MGTELYRLDNGISVAQFYGGKDKGICIQITGDTGYVQLTMNNVADIIRVLRDWHQEEARSEEEKKEERQQKPTSKVE